MFADELTRQPSSIPRADLSHANFICFKKKKKYDNLESP